MVENSGILWRVSRRNHNIGRQSKSTNRRPSVEQSEESKKSCNSHWVSCWLTDRQGWDGSGQNEVTESDRVPLAKWGHQHADWLCLDVIGGHAWETKEGHTVTRRGRVEYNQKESSATVINVVKSRLGTCCVLDKDGQTLLYPREKTLSVIIIPKEDSAAVKDMRPPGPQSPEAFTTYCFLRPALPPHHNPPIETQNNPPTHTHLQTHPLLCSPSRIR